MLPQRGENNIFLLQRADVDICVLHRKPQRLMYDKAADEDRLRETLKVRGISFISPHRTKSPTQDDRPLRRCQRRFKAERTMSWLHNVCRLIIRRKYEPEPFESFLHLACLHTIPRGFETSTTEQ